ncbi:MAG TPA: glycosyltransferase [Candidatus Acidoferrales bacterium]|nr:glycosyltransferase [Candidatus Acidoferrales bacterium]
MRTPLTIVHVVRSLERGGLERVAVDLAAAQIAAGNSALIYSVYDLEPALLPDAEAAGVPVIQFRKPPGFSPGTLREMAARLGRDRAAVVHTHNELVHTYGAIAARLAGAPCVVNTIHGTKRGEDRRLDRNYRMLLPWTDAVVAVSHETLAQFAAPRARYRRKFHVIRNGIAAGKFAAQSAEPGSRWPSLRIGTVARLVKIKDQATLIRAFAVVRRNFPGAELHLLGDGPLRGNLEFLSGQLGLGPSVTFHGESARVAEFLSGLDVFALSSLSEGIPLAVLEAMAAGLPIVSTNVGGVSEAAPEGAAAAYSPPHHPLALAQALQSVLDPQRLKSMGRAAQRIALRSFTLEAMTEEYQTVYETLLAKKSWHWLSLIPRFS